MKMTTLTCALAFLLVLLANSLFAQFVPTALQPPNPVIQGLTQQVEPAGWLFMKDDAQVLANDLFTTYKTNMGLGSDDAMVVIKDATDEYGWQHVRYQQYYKNIKVEGAEYTDHLQDCILKNANGKRLGSVVPRLHVEGLSTAAGIRVIPFQHQRVDAGRGEDRRTKI